MANSAAKRPKKAYSLGRPSHHRVNGTVATPSNDPKDAYRVIATTITHTTAATIAAFHESPMSTPKDVAMPFPPPKRRKIDQLCPAMAATPQSTTIPAVDS